MSSHDETEFFPQDLTRLQARGLLVWIPIWRLTGQETVSKLIQAVWKNLFPGSWMTEDPGFLLAVSWRLLSCLVAHSILQPGILHQTSQILLQDDQQNLSLRCVEMESCRT